MYRILQLTHFSFLSQSIKLKASGKAKFVIDNEGQFAICAVMGTSIVAIVSKADEG